MEHTTQTAPNPSEQEKQAIFARVWKRVMAGQEAACPLTWTDPVPQAETAAAPAPAPADPGEGAGQPALPVACPVPQPRGDFPQAETAGVLGPGCLECAPLLQSLIRRELADGREYQTLARRASGAPARVLAALAGEKKRRARKVSAAYFLIAGVRYWPEAAPCPPMPSYLGALRRRFGQEQAAMAAYLAGAEATEDPCLRQLFWDHAQENWDQACRVRALVEQLC